MKQRQKSTSCPSETEKPLPPGSEPHEPKNALNTPNRPPRKNEKDKTDRALSVAG
jgi:hypothetical protein